jgi:transposase
MYKVKLQEKELMELNNLKKKYQGDWKIFRRLKCIELRSEGYKPRKVSEKLDVSQDSITDWVKLFLE